MRLTLCLLAFIAPTFCLANPAADTAKKLGEQAIESEQPYLELTELCDHYGARISGSETLERAIDWAVEKFKADGLKTHKEPVSVPKWVRGEASARIFGPIERDMHLLALGGSGSTPKRGLRAPLTVVESFEELEKLGEKVAGHVVLYDVPFTTYGETVKFRRFGAIRAAQYGAVASLIRSVSPTSLYTPHTGNMSTPEKGTPLPAAALTLEDASWLNRLSKQGEPLEIELNIQAQQHKNATSHNVIAEIPGSELPNEIVVAACHIDSWDVGQGAHDDGAGCVMVMEAARLIQALDKAPRRTTRFILYTNEENGLQGGVQYAQAHQSEIVNHVAAIEADTGAGTPYGFRMDLRREKPEESEARLAEIIPSLTDLETALRPYSTEEEDIFIPGFGGADISPLINQGVLGFGLRQDMTDYWPIHHTEADTLDKIDPQLLRRNTAQMTIATYLLAELDWNIPRERK